MLEGVSLTGMGVSAVCTPGSDEQSTSEKHKSPPRLSTHTAPDYSKTSRLACVPRGGARTTSRNPCVTLPPRIGKEKPPSLQTSTALHVRPFFETQLSGKSSGHHPATTLYA